MAKQSIPQASYPVNNVRLLPDQVKGDAPFVKETFDKGTEDGKTYINSTLIPALNGNTGANMIGLSNPNLSSDNVGDSVEEIRLIAIQAQAGDLLPNSVTNTILGADVKVGSLAELATTDKTSVTNAINELEGEVDTLQSDVSDIQADLTATSTGLEILRKYNVTTGSNVALAVDTFGTFDLTKTGNILNILPNVTNTGTMTINADGQGAKAIKKFNVDTDAYVDLEASDIKKNTPTSLSWDLANNFFVLAPKSGATIKSIQRGTVTISSTTQNVTISQVDQSKSKVVINVQLGSNNAEKGATAKLTSQTNIEFKAFAIGATITWQVVEYKEIKSFQSGSFINQNLSAGYNVSVSGVDVSKAELYFSYRLNTTGSGHLAMDCTATLNSSTNILFDNTVNQLFGTVEWFLVEYK